MEVSDIKTFIETSIANKKQWIRISILGGEPTLHPDFKEIIALIHNEYIIKYSPKTRIRLVSNQFTEKSRILCEEVKEKYNSIRVNYGSIKTDKEIEGFIPFNDAPIDDEQFTENDYKKGCSITSVTGLGLNKRGYYPCGVAAGMDRILNKNLAIPNQKEITTEKLQKQLEEFCRYCGHFKIGDNHIKQQENYKNKVSKSWKLMYREYNREERRNKAK